MNLFLVSIHRDTTWATLADRRARTQPLQGSVVGDEVAGFHDGASEKITALLSGV
jgi:hypothetical protein